MKDTDPAIPTVSPAGVIYCNDRPFEGLCLCDRPDGHDADGDQHECRCGARW